MKEFKIGNQFKNMEKILPFLLLSILFATPVLAQVNDTADYCRDNITLAKVTTTVVNVPELGVTRTINSVENVTCPDGCDMTHNVCYDTVSNSWLKAIFIILGVIGIIIVLAVIFG